MTSGSGGVRCSTWGPNNRTIEGTFRTPRALPAGHRHWPLHWLSVTGPSHRHAGWWLLVAALLLVQPASAMRPMKLLETPRVAPTFDLPATDGTRRSLENYRGRHVLVNFWAVWCAPCREEMPSMQAVYDRLGGDDFTMLAIHVGPSIDGARDFAERLALSFDIVVDEDMGLTDWQVLGLPTTFLLDREGRIVAEAVGERDWNDPGLVEQLKQQISGASPD